MRMQTSVSAAVLAFAVLIISGCANTHEQAQVTTSDKVITSTIKTRHAANKEVALTHISVETLYGVVLLSGVAKTPQEKISAQEIAQQVDGVKAVHNEIMIETNETDRNKTDSSKTPHDEAAPDARI